MALSVAIRPNISASGCQRRDRLGKQMVVVSAVLLAALLAFHAAWTWRLLMFLPAAGAATSILQSRRTTCVLRARQGTFENEDGSTTNVSDEESRASRAIARGIQRDAVLIGLAVAALAVALAFI